MSPPVYLGLLLAGTILLGGGIYYFSQMPRKLQPLKEWDTNYDAFVLRIKQTEAARPKERSKEFSLPQLEWMYGKTVQWEGGYYGVGEIDSVNKMARIRFDLESKHSFPVDDPRDTRMGAIYHTHFRCAESNVPTWKAIPEGTKVRFTGRIDARDRLYMTDSNTPLYIAFETTIHIDDVMPIRE